MSLPPPSGSLKACQLEQYMNPVFVETGTFLGNGISYALECSFEKIISIDINENYVLGARRIFAEYPNVTVIQGDSNTCLWDAIKDIDKRITFWLDGHVFVGNEDEAFSCPIASELEQINKHPIKDHDLIIDDISSIILLPNHSKNDLKEMTLKINNNYKLKYFERGGSEALIASVRG